MPNETCPVVTIKTKNGPVEINKHEFDPDKHELHDTSGAGGSKDDDEGADAGHGLKIKGQGKGEAKVFVVIDKDKNQVGGETYKTKEDAQAFIDLMHPPVK